MSTLWLDLETYSETPIKFGVHAYAENAEIMLVAWAIDDGPVNVWDRTKDALIPYVLSVALCDPSVLICAHKSDFDRTVLAKATNTNPIFIKAANSRVRWRDTMVKAYAHSLPGALGDLCDVFQLTSDKAKDKEGRTLVMLFCKPRPATSAVRRATRETDPDKWAKFVAYAAQDIVSMRELYSKIPSWNYRGEELALWHLDQAINDRGVCVDTDLANAAIRGVERAQAILGSRTRVVTNDEVQTATQRNAMLAHILKEYGITLPDMQKATLERRIDDPSLPLALRELLAIRLQASTTSTAKYKTLINGASSDGRLRGTLQFDGASRTGRWAGRLFQPQNLPRPTLDQNTIDAGIDALKADCEDLVFDNVMALTSSAIRGCIVAPKGKKLVISDLSNIEGRAQAWLAGEDWKLKAFNEFDAGNGPDLYKLAYSKSFGIKPEDVTKDQRQVGKVQELALGYEGGVGAFLTFAMNYNLDLDDMAEQAFDAIPTPIMAESRSAYAWFIKQRRSTFGLKERTWLVCESFKRSWRYAHPNIAQMWKDLDEAVRFAIARPNIPFPCRTLTVQRDGAWLRIRLPSGRFLCYPSPKIEDSTITYMGINQYSRKWSRLSTYGGKLFENVCQAFARDIMAANMPTIDKSGYEINLSVHDELITETPDTPEFSHEHLSTLLSTQPVWAADMPLAAGGFESYRYKKD